MRFAPPEVRRLDDGRRLHLCHGPIDLVVEACGPAAEVDRAYAAAEARFAGVLGELVAELPRLRRPLDGTSFEGAVARRMAAAAARFPECFVTPMAAVAGAVADEILAALRAASDCRKAYVNNGGDIALWLAAGERLAVGLLPRAGGHGHDVDLLGRLELAAADGIGGIATSGARGRSFSLGIADAATVLAADAAQADAAATLIANAVDVESPLVARRPARALDPDSDLGRRLVTVAVGRLPPALRARALDRGAARAGEMLEDGRIRGAALALQGELRLLGEALSGLPRPLAPAL